MAESLQRIWEQTLVLRAQTGDDRAFGELVEVFHKPLQSHVQRLLGTREAADDILQETWIDAYRNLPRLRKIEAFRCWLFRIARAKTALHLRASHKSLSLDAFPVAQIEQRADREPDFSAEDLRCLSQCLERLSLAHREVLLLRFVQNMSYEEIGDVTGCELGTVRSRLYYAKQSLRQEMERLSQ